MVCYIHKRIEEIAYKNNPSEWNINNSKKLTDRNNSFRRVGIMYPSDYGYAVGGSVRTSN